MSDFKYTILFVSSTYKGDVMLQTAKELGCRVWLLTEDSLHHEPWPRQWIDEMFYTPDLRRYQDVINTVTWMCRGAIIDLIVPLDEFEVELVAILREHLRLPGMQITATHQFRDKLAMREITHKAGIPVPDFIQVLNYDRVRDYMARVASPWMLKPRMEAGSMGIHKIHDSEKLWRVLDQLGDRQSYYLLEQFLPGDVYHVDSLTVASKTIFASAQKYAAPPIDIYQGGGVFATRTLDHNSEEAQALYARNLEVIQALGMENGVTHAEFIRGHADGKFYFLEVAARVGGAFISDMIEMATGVNLWREWMRLEFASLEGKKYTLPKIKRNYSGIILTLAKYEHPDMSAYNDKEIVWRAQKPNHAGVIVVSKDAARIETLISSYRERFQQDFTTRAAPMDATRTGYTG